MSADKTVEIGSSSTVNVDGAATMHSTGISLSSDVMISLNASITADSLDMTAGNEAELKSGASVTVTNNFNMEAESEYECTINSFATISAGSETGNCLE